MGTMAGVACIALARADRIPSFFPRLKPWAIMFGPSGATITAEFVDRRQQPERQRHQDGDPPAEGRLVASAPYPLEAPDDPNLSIPTRLLSTG